MPVLFPLGRLAVLLLVTTLCACQTLGRTALVTSTVTSDLAPEVADAVAGDMVSHLAGRVGPGTTTIALSPDGSVFGEALEASLRRQGYAIVTDQETGDMAAIPLAYVVDDFEGNVLVRLSMTALDMTQIYRVSATGVEPAGALSVMAQTTEPIS